MASLNDLVIEQGSTFRLRTLYALPPEDGSTPTIANVIPIDLTGCTARMQVRDKYGAPVLLEITTENGGITLSGVTGWIDLVLTAVQTDMLGHKDGSTRPRTAGVYDLELVYPSGDVKRIMQGAITFDPNITRAP